MALPGGDTKSAALHDIDKKLTAMRKERRKLRRETSDGRTVSTYNVCLLKSLVVQASGNIEVPLKFMEQKGVDRFGPRTTTTWDTYLSDFWKKITDAEKTRFSTNPLTSIERNAVSSASKFIKEYSLFSWLKQQNEEHKIAPSSEALLRRATDEDTCPVTPIIKETKGSKTAYQSLRRYRRRWGVTNAAIKPKEPLCSSVKQRKATGETSLFEHTQTQRRTPEFRM